MNQIATNKIKRTLKLFFGMRQSAVRDALAPYGFDRAVMQEGFQLLHRATRLRLDPLMVSDSAPKLVARLDAFENAWFPVAKVVLSRAYPELSAQLFANLRQQNGQEVALSAAIFLDRLEKMAQGEAPFGADGPAARAVLAARGLTDEREAEAQALVDEMTLTKEAPAAPVNVDEQQAAVDEMWAWYLEWSTIARTAIKQKRLLRTLGFGPRRKASTSDIEIEEENSEGSADVSDDDFLDFTPSPPAPQLSAVSAASQPAE